jgi:hypothetical protein
VKAAVLSRLVAGGLIVQLLNGSHIAILMIGLGISCGVGNAKDIYIAQNAVGSNNGTSCANAYAVSFFNTTSSWGTGATQIGPGTTVHLCGTFSAPSAGTTMLTVQGNGSSGNPVTVLFEPGAVLTSPAWHYNGAIYNNGHNYITIDGGTNGIIQATASGIGMANNSHSTGVMDTGGSNFTAQNLTISNMFVSTYNNTDHSCDSAPFDSSCGMGIEVSGAVSNITIRHNTIHDAHIGIFVFYPANGTASNITVASNVVYHTVGAILLGPGGCNGTMTGLVVDGNQLYDGLPWFSSDNYFHLDGIFVNAGNSCGGGANHNTFTSPVISNNWIYGNWGGMTAKLFFSQDAGGTYTNGLVYNNVFDSSGTQSADGEIYIQGGAQALGIYNNTFIENPRGGGLAIDYANTGGTPAGSMTIKNNIMQGISYYIVAPVGYITESDYNLFYQGTQYFLYGSTNYDFSGWRGLGFDAHSQNVNTANLNANYVPNAGSVVNGNGVNLTSLGIVGLDADAAGKPRPSTGAWTIGAYEVPLTSPAPPTGLTTTAH